MRCDITEKVLGNNSAGSFGVRSSIQLLALTLATVLLAYSGPFLFAQEITSEAKSIYAQASGLSEASDKVTLLRQALNLSPNYVAARLDLAKMLMEIGDYSQAKIQVDSTLNYGRGNPYVWFHKGRAHAFAGEDQAARKSFERAIRIKDDSPEFYLSLGRLQFRTSAWDQALPVFEKALSSAITAQSTGEQAEAWYWKGRIHSAQNDTSTAIGSFKKALSLKATHKDAATRLADIEEHIQLQRSYRSADAAIEQKDWLEAESNLRDILARNVDFKDAPQKLTIVRNEIRASERKLALESDPPREQGAKLASKSPIRMEPSPTKTDLPAAVDIDSTTRSTELVAEPQVEDSSSQTVVNLPEQGRGPGVSSKFGVSETVLWLGGATLFLVALLGLFIYKKRATSAHAGKSTSLSSQYAETKTVIVPKDVLKTEFGRYRIERVLGQGGMGKVYKAQDLKLERPVALKVIRLQSGTNDAEVKERINRFRREAKATAILNHPNIVSLYDYDEQDGVFYMTMEYVEGQSIQELLDKNAPMPLEQAVKIVRESCQALDYAHRHQVVHRDIKPPNIMVNTEGRIKVLDFGVAKMLNLTQTQSPTMTGMRLGSPMYMSPEQINAGILDGRSDIFALGVVFYQMLTGAKPFNINEGDSLSRLFYVILQTEPPAPSAIRGELSQRWDGILGKMLAKNPDERYQNAREVISAIAPT